jgi:hypothetical protein
MTAICFEIRCVLKNGQLSTVCARSMFECRQSRSPTKSSQLVPKDELHCNRLSIFDHLIKHQSLSKRRRRQGLKIYCNRAVVSVAFALADCDCTVELTVTAMMARIIVRKVTFGITNTVARPIVKRRRRIESAGWLLLLGIW